MSNWTDDTSTPVCADSSPFDTWSGWSASQRDLFVLDQDGNLIHHQNITSGIPSDLEELIISNLNTDATDLSAKSFRLNQNYPNPFNPSTTIKYDIGLMDGLEQRVSVNVYNVVGQQVTTLVNNVSQVGQFYVKWDGADKFGKSLPSGIYFIQLKTDSGIIKNKKMMFLK